MRELFADDETLSRSSAAVRPSAMRPRHDCARVCGAPASGMDDSLWILGVRFAGLFHFVTLAFALFTPIPPNWSENLARLPEIHRRFAVAQNFFIGATIAFLGAACVFFAADLVAGSSTARLLCAAVALWWGGRLVVLPWLGIWPQLGGAFWKIGFAVLHLECAIYALAFGWLALRRS